jgi:hypothetical protein
MLNIRSHTNRSSVIETYIYIKKYNTGKHLDLTNFPLGKFLSAKKIQKILRNLSFLDFPKHPQKIDLYYTRK